MSNKTSDKNVANIEDDIKLVKRYLENSAYKETDSDFFKNGGWEMVDLEIPKAIEKLLQDYTRQKQINEEHKKINGELREKVKELENENISKQKAYDDCYCEYKHYKQFESISIQKIIEKIEELEKISNNTYIEFLETNKTDADLHDKGLIIDGKIQALKELLQEGEDK